jgi:hypothetical protein
MEKKMRPSICEAELLVVNWIDTQVDVPRSRLILTYGHSEKNGGRLFEVMYDVASLSMRFHLLRLYVLDDATIKIKKDRRTKVRRILNSHGISMDADLELSNCYEHPEAIEKLTTALHGTSVQPEWLIRTEVLPGANRKSAIDGHVEVAVKDRTGSRTTKIPFKIKTSRRAKADYFTTNSVATTNYVVVLLIKRGTSDQDMLQEFYNLLEHKIKYRLFVD